MPQKLNKAGKMQDYIPAGNGDPSGEYGTSKGTNKNFTASDKKSKANVITENKQVSFADKMAKKYDMPISKFDEVIDSYTQTEKELRAKGKIEDADWYKAQIEKEKKFKQEAIEARKEKETKANVIDGDLTGKNKPLVDDKTQKEINDRISGWDNKMRYMMLSRMQSDVKYYLGAGGRSTKDLWAKDEKEHIAYMETLYNGLKEKPEWLSKKELENYKKELLKK